MTEDGIESVLDLPGIDGFLGTRGSLMMDIVFIALFAVLPLLLLSIYAVRYRKNYALHKQLQIGLGVLLLVTIVLFEVDIQYISKWEQRAEASPFFDSTQMWSDWVGWSLLVHLCFAVPTAALWVFVIVQALRHFPRPPRPGGYSQRHKWWSRVTAVFTTMTALTGWLFYWLAFAL